jgi:hypothetical protein
MKNEFLTLTPNGRGATAYLSRDLLEDSACPLCQGRDVRAELHHGIGILLVESSDTTTYTIQRNNDE